MKYVYLTDQSEVYYVIPDDPDNPIEKRYAPNFINHLIKVNDDVEVEVGMIRTSDGAFVWPERPEPVPPEPTPDEPTQDDINLDFDFRLSCLELGI